MSEEQLSSLSKIVPTLTGTDNFVKWRRAIQNYLLDKGAFRVLLGEETEPHRLATPFHVPERDGLFASLRMPQGAVDPFPATSVTGNNLTTAQKTEWFAWEAKERKARSTLLLTISPALAEELENLWSANEIYERICREHRVNTVERRGELQQRISFLRLQPDASREQMLQHYDAYVGLVAELAQAGAPFPEWQKCQNFLMSMGKDFQMLKMQFRIVPDEAQSFSELTRLYKALADSKGFEEERDASINAFINKDAIRGKGKFQRGDNGKPASPHKAGSPKNNKKNANKAQLKCDWCGIRGHVADKCRKKSSGEPSLTALKEAARHIDAKRDKSNSKGEASHVDGWIDSSGSLYAVGVSPHASDFLIDTGATHHLTHDASIVEGMTKLARPLVFGLAGHSSTLSVTHKGSVVLHIGTHPVFIEDVHYAPNARINILSEGLLREQGWNVDLDKNVITSGVKHIRISRNGRLPYIKVGNKPLAAPVVPVVATAVTDSPMQDLHRRLGHLGPSAILQLAKEGLIEVSEDVLKKDTFTLADCKVCATQKATKLPKGGTSPRGNADGEMVHVDIKGQVRPSLAGNAYYVGMVADYTKVRLAQPIVTKDAAFSQLQVFIARLERQASIKVKVVRSDQGGEFNSATAQSWYKSLGINHQMSPRYTQELNGVAERFNRTVSEMISTMVASSPLGHAYWDFAAKYASVILNKTTRSENGKTAWEIITGRSPNLDSIYEWGSPCYAHIPADLRSKASFETPKSVSARILGQDEGLSGWIVRYEHTGAIQFSRDIRLASEPMDTPLMAIKAPEPQAKALEEPRIQQPNVAPSTKAPAPPNTPAGPPTTSPSAAAPAAAPAQPVIITQPSRVPSEQSSVLPQTISNPDSIAAPLPAPSVAQPLPQKATAIPTRRSDRVAQRTGQHNDPTVALIVEESAYAFAVNCTTSKDPSTVREALEGQDAAHWIEAMKAELQNLVSKGTFKEVELPAGRKAIGSKWVFKLKTDADGKPVKYKARLVAQGFSQTRGIDFDETFAPVGRMASLRILLAVAASYDLSLHQADVEGAYLNGKIDVELYIAIPDGMTPTNPSCNALRLYKSLYGLKQSGRTWWLELGSVLAKIGFVRCDNDWGLYVLRNSDGSPAMVMLAYVDDLLVAAKNVNDIKRVFAYLNKHWRITELGEAKHILGLKIERTKHQIRLSQTAYIEKLDERFPFHQTRKGRLAPLPVATDRGDEEDDPEVSAKRYQELVGSLMWAAGCTRPDISYAASYLARSSSAPRQSDWEKAVRVLSYLVGSKHLGIVLGSAHNAEKDQLLTTYVDSDWAGDKESRRSTTGHISYLLDSPINWSSRRQDTVALSSMEAEYVAASEAARDMIWIRFLLAEIGLPQGPTVLHVDNQSAIKLAHNPFNHSRSKHYELKHHFIREKVEEGVIRLEYIRSAEQRADVLTKALAGPKHAEQLAKLNLASTFESFDLDIHDTQNPSSNKP